MPDLIRHPVPFWIPASAGMTTVGYLTTGLMVLRLHQMLKPGSLGPSKIPLRGSQRHLALPE